MKMKYSSQGLLDISTSKGLQIRSRRLRGIHKSKLSARLHREAATPGQRGRFASLRLALVAAGVC